VCGTWVDVEPEDIPDVAILIGPYPDDCPPCDGCCGSTAKARPGSGTQQTGPPLHRPDATRGDSPRWRESLSASRTSGRIAVFAQIGSLALATSTMIARIQVWAGSLSRRLCQTRWRSKGASRNGGGRRRTG
jgi:hypothetical protein